MKPLLGLLTIWVAFLLARMLVKGSTAGGITRRDVPTAYWTIAFTHAAVIAFLIYLLLHTRI